MVLKVRYAFLVGLVLSLITLSAGCSLDPNVRKLKFVAEGDHRFQQEKYAEAIIEYGRALQIDPQFADAHYKLAQCYLKQNLWAGAYQELLRTVNLRPDDWAAQLDLGKLLLSAGKGEQAKVRANILLKGSPKNLEAQILLSDADTLLGNSKDAVEEAREAVRIAPDNANAYLNLGLVLARSDEHPEAEENLKKAQQLAPEDAGPLMTLGTYYERQGRWQDAEGQFQKAIQVAAKNPVPRAALADLYRSEGKEDQAVKVLTDAKLQLSDDPNAYRLLGDFYVRQGNTTQSLAEFASLAQEHPKDLKVRKSYIQLLIIAGRISDAATLTDETLKSFPQDADALVLKGEILLKQKDNARALSILQRAVQDAPDSATGHYQLGMALQATGSDSQALNEWKNAVQIRPDLVEAWIALGSAATNRKDWRGLEADGLQLQKIAPRSPQGYLFHATARFNQEDSVGAEADLVRLVAALPQSAIGYAKLGQLRAAQKRWKDAENYYNEALAHDPNSLEAVGGLTALNLDQGKSEQALQFIQSEITKNSGNAALYLFQGEALLRIKRFPEAQEALLHCIQLDSQNLAALVRLAQVQASLDEPSQAISSYQRAISVAPQDNQLYAALGRALEAQGDWRQAEDTYQKALAIQSDDAVAANNLAYLMLEHGGDSNVILTIARTARRGLPNSPNSADTLGWAYFQIGAYSLAEPLLVQAVKQAPSNGVYHYHLGMTLQKLKETERARAELEKSIQLSPQASFAPTASEALGKLAGG